MGAGATPTGPGRRWWCTLWHRSHPFTLTVVDDTGVERVRFCGVCWREYKA